MDKYTQISAIKRCLLILLTLFLISCTSNASDNKTNNSSENNYIKKSSFKLNTIVSITIYDSSDETLIDECFNLCDYYENIFSRTLPESELYKLNTLKKGQVSDDLAELIRLALKYCELSDGIFDITIAPVSSLWDFQAAEPKVPENSTILENLSYVNYKNIEITDDNFVTLKTPNTNIDLGAVAKGYIADKLKKYLVDQGVNSAIIDLGGNILLIGQKTDNSLFKIGIQKPFYSYSETAAVMELKDVSIVSSGIYERCFTADDIFYHHLLNAHTGYPENNTLTSVTIITSSSAEADVLSTTSFLLGKTKGLELINSLENVHAVFITEDGTLHYSDGFFDDITIVSD